MKFEVIEQAGTWIVQHQGEEVARFDERVSALAEVARRLRDADLGGAAASLSMRYQARAS